MDSKEELEVYHGIKIKIQQSFDGLPGFYTGRIQIRSATPMDSMNEGGVLRTVDQQLSIHGQR